MKINRALISVSDKEGIVNFSKSLLKIGIDIISTGGTASLLNEKGIQIHEVSDITGGKLWQQLWVLRPVASLVVAWWLWLGKILPKPKIRKPLIKILNKLEDIVRKTPTDEAAQALKKQTQWLIDVADGKIDWIDEFIK